MGVRAPVNESSMISAKLGELSGASEEDTVSDEALKPTSGSRRTAAGDAGPPGPPRLYRRRAAVPSKDRGCRIRTWPIQRCRYHREAASAAR